MRALALVFVLCAGGCDVGAVPFVCVDNLQCIEDGVLGDCEANGYCSFPDSSCESGARYAIHASEELSEQCVPKCIAEIALGKAHGCLRKTDGTVWCWGDNGRGQIGPGNTTGAPQQVHGIVGARALALGDAHSCAIAGNPPTVWCWGANDEGQCGAPPTAQVDPTPVALPEEPALIGLGARHSCASAGADVGLLRCWGANDEGQLGVLPSEPHAAPVESDFRAAALAAGGGSTCVVTSGHAACWGDNACGQIDPMAVDPVPYTMPVKTDFAQSVAVGTTFGCVVLGTKVICSGWLEKGTPCTPAQRGATITGTNEHQGPSQASAGRSHACVVYRAGEVECWGAANAGQLGPATTADSPDSAIILDGVPLSAQVAAGGDTSCALTSTGEVLCWGANDHSQLGKDPGAPQPDPVSWVSDAVSCP